uniref:Serine and arginine rich splicing factor 6a n=1 Tax=Gasterosteus aculeatus TaxID=69293 RepID=G3NRX0_GASAC
MPRVYIGRLSYHVREKDIERFFGGYGKLMEIDLKNGYGFVEFEDNRDADDAVYELNGKELCGERVIVENARGPRRDRDGYGGGHLGGGRSSGYSSRSRTGRDKYGPPVRTEYRLIVENLSSRCSWQDLKDFMRQAGEVTYADAHKERTNEGVIEFRSESDLRRAIDKLDGTDINGRKIRLVEERPRKRRSYSGSRSRSRSRRSRSRRSSRSRSRSHSRKSRSKSGGRESRSRNRRSRSRSADRKAKSRSRSPRSRSRSADRKAKSRSRSADRKAKSRSRSADRKAKSRSRSPRSRSRSADRKSKSRSKSRSKSPSRSPSPREDDRRSKSREKRSASRSKSRSRSRSASRD